MEGSLEIMVDKLNHGTQAEKFIVKLRNFEKVIWEWDVEYKAEC